MHVCGRPQKLPRLSLVYRAKFGSNGMKVRKGSKITPGRWDPSIHAENLLKLRPQLCEAGLIHSHTHMQTDSNENITFSVVSDAEGIRNIGETDELCSLR